MDHLFKNNHQWAERIKQEDPLFFEKLAKQQAPEYLWIGCSDSRVPANEIVGLLPGELFVHRNVANMVVHTDLNCLSVIQYAVEYLKVKHIIVCGHYGCGGVRSAVEKQKLGLIDCWLNHIHDVQATHRIDECQETDKKVLTDYVCELNVLEQAMNVCETNIVQSAWSRQQPLTVHTWIYGVHDGLLNDLGLACSSEDEMGGAYQQALEGIKARYPRAAANN